jgi:hypothetical protein
MVLHVSNKGFGGGGGVKRHDGSRFVWSRDTVVIKDIQWCPMIFLCFFTILGTQFLSPFWNGVKFSLFSLSGIVFVFSPINTRYTQHYSDHHSSTCKRLVYKHLKIHTRIYQIREARVAAYFFLAINNNETKQGWKKDTYFQNRSFETFTFELMRTRQNRYSSFFCFVFCFFKTPGIFVLFTCVFDNLRFI